MRARRYLLATGLIAALALAGCSSDSSSDQASSTAGGAAQEAPAARAPEQGGTAKDQATAPEAQAPNLSIDQRSIIYTGSITVRVKDVSAAAAQASSFAAGAGGFVGADERHSGSSSSGTDNASLTLRVPADKFNAVVEQLAGLGTEQQRGTSTEDVTEQTVDLDARIAIQQARVESGRRLLAQAKSLNDLVMLEKEVATRESDLASLQAKKRKLADLTALSTITAVLLGPEAVITQKDDGPPGFLAGLKGGWDALVASLTVLLTVLGALLPWLLALGIPAWIAFYLIRRFGRRPRPAAALAGTGTPLPPYPAGVMQAQGRPQGVPGTAPPVAPQAPSTRPAGTPAPSSSPPAGTIAKAPPASPSAPPASPSTPATASSTPPPSTPPVGGPPPAVG